MAKVIYDKSKIELYRTHPELAHEAINSYLNENDQAGALITLRYLAQSQGGMLQLAQDAKLNATQIYRTLSENGNPSLSNWCAILQALGLQMGIKKLPAEDK